MKLKRRRKLITYLNILDQPIRFNPFVFSRTFLLWAILGLVGGAAGYALAYTSPFFLGAATARGAMRGLAATVLGGRTFGLRPAGHRHG